MTSNQKSSYHAKGMGNDPDSNAGVDYLKADQEMQYLIGSLMGDPGSEDLRHGENDPLPQGPNYLEPDDGLYGHLRQWYDEVAEREERPDNFEDHDEWQTYLENAEERLDRLDPRN